MTLMIRKAIQVRPRMVMQSEAARATPRRQQETRTEIGAMDRIRGMGCSEL